MKERSIDFSDDTFKVGQIWNYNTRAGEEASRFTVLKVEQYDSAGIVIHIFVDGLKVKNGQSPSGFSDDIAHTPISKNALQNSITTLVSENNALS